MFKGILFIIFFFISVYPAKARFEAPSDINYWLFLNREKNIEYVYFGKIGQVYESRLVSIFKVKSGIPLKRPTPLPSLIGKEYFLITDKYDTYNNPETSPYFLTLNVPYDEKYPYGPFPYNECNGQCNWEVPGSFGLHGINGDFSRMSDANPGSSGCIRHYDNDISYLYFLIHDNREIRYYIKDSSVSLTYLPMGDIFTSWHIDPKM